MEYLKNYPVVYEQKVAWGDMDAFNHVNNVVYYRYIESARIAYFEKLNILNLDVNTVVASSQCKYIKPVLYPDTISIGSCVVELSNSAMRMEYCLYSHQQQTALLHKDLKCKAPLIEPNLRRNLGKWST